MIIQQQLVPWALYPRARGPFIPNQSLHRFMALPSVANMDTGIDTTRRWPGVVTSEVTKD
jgi:hypothetical protein